MLRTALCAFCLLSIATVGFAQDGTGKRDSGAKPKASKQVSNPDSTKIPLGKRKRKQKAAIQLDETPLQDKNWPPKDLKDPKEIFAALAKRMEGLVRIHYEVTLKGTGALSPKLGQLWGTMMMEGFADGSLVSFRMMITDLIPGPSNLETAMIGSNGKVYFLIDVKNNTVTDSYDPVIMGDMAKILPYFAVDQFVNPDRFKKESNAAILEYKGEEVLAAVPCYHVHVSNAQGTEKEDWFIVKQTLLPHLIVRESIDKSGVSSGTRLTFGPITFNPSTMNDPFVSFVPKGSTRIGPELVPPKKKKGKKNKKKNAKKKDDIEKKTEGKNEADNKTTDPAPKQ